MGDEFARLLVKATRVDATWHGRFRERALAGLAYLPAASAAIYQYMQSLGDQLETISVETELSPADGIYAISASNVHVDLRTQQLEMAFSDWSGDTEGFGASIEGLRKALTEVSGDLTIVDVDLGLDVWAELQSGSYSDWWAGLVRMPAEFREVPSGLSLTAPDWSFLMEPAARFSLGGLHLRFTGKYPADVPEAEQVIRARAHLSAILERFGVIES